MVHMETTHCCTAGGDGQYPLERFALLHAVPAADRHVRPECQHAGVPLLRGRGPGEPAGGLGGGQGSLQIPQHWPHSGDPVQRLHWDSTVMAAGQGDFTH